MSTAGSRRLIADEVWAINSMAHALQHDRAFVMDDLGQIRRRAEGTIAHGMMAWLHEHPGPLYMTRTSPDVPGSVAYPIHEVAESVGVMYFNTTVAYAVALAIHEKAETISLYGCDFPHEAGSRTEPPPPE